MVKLFKYDREKRAWVHVDYGLKHLAHLYNKQGYLVAYDGALWR